MKINIDRVLVNNQNKIVKKLPTILELDSIKSLSVNSIDNTPYAENVIDSDGLTLSGEICARITIKWMDGEEQALIIPDYELNLLLEYVSTAFKNVYYAEIDNYYEDAEDEDAEEEIEEEELLDDEEDEEEPYLPFVEVVK